MIVPDVNLLVHAHNSRSRQHEAARNWWEDLMNGTGRQSDHGRASRGPCDGAPGRTPPDRCRYGPVSWVALEESSRLTGNCCDACHPQAGSWSPKIEESLREVRASTRQHCTYVFVLLCVPGRSWVPFPVLIFSTDGFDGVNSRQRSTEHSQCCPCARAKRSATPRSRPRQSTPTVPMRTLSKRWKRSEQSSPPRRRVSIHGWQRIDNSTPAPRVAEHVERVHQSSATVSPV